MVVTPGQVGRNDWMYTCNPWFMSLTDRKNHNKSIAGIGDASKNGDEKIYFFQKKTIEDVLGLDVMVGGSEEDRQTLCNSNFVVSFHWYKWAIGYVKTAANDYTFVVFYNDMYSIKRLTYGTAGYFPFVSFNQTKTSKLWRYNTVAVNSLDLVNIDFSTINYDYRDLMFECADFVEGDTGYDALVAYLLSDSGMPGGGGDTPSGDNDDPYSSLIPPSYPSPTQPDTPGRANVPIELPQLPGSAFHSINTGFVSLYAPSSTQLQGLATKLWSSDFFDNIIKNFSDPMDAILSLGIVPFTVSGTNSIVKIGNWDSKNLYMPKVSDQYRIVDLGTTLINEATGSYMDYSPYTRIHLFLPYIGFVQLNTDEVMGKNVGIVYYVDLLTGSCVAYITVEGYVHSQYVGNVMTVIPLSGRDKSSLYQAEIMIGLSAVGKVAGGGLGAALSQGALAASASTVMNSKDRVEMGSSLEGSASLLGTQFPYFVIESPRGCLPNNQNAIMGYPSYMTTKLGSLSGYTEVDKIHLEGIPCTESELVEIEELLKGGVII